MKKNDLQKFREKNGIRAAIWVMVLLFCAYYVRARVADKFMTQGDEVSVHRYNLSVVILLMIVTFATAFWWCCATFSTGVSRRTIEEYSFLGSLIFIILVIGATAIIGFYNHSIMDNNGQLHTVWYVLIFPVIFGCLMYCIPPVNLEKVIWPFGPRSIAWMVSAAIFLGTAYLLFIR